MPAMQRVLDNAIGLFEMMWLEEAKGRNLSQPENKAGFRFALEKRAKYIVLVPCCQAEVAAFLRNDKGDAKAKGSIAELWRHPIHTREFGAQVTNVLRGLQLEAHGYQVTVTELVGWEHSMKNELIIAQYKNLPRAQPRERLVDALDAFGLTALGPRFAAS